MSLARILRVAALDLRHNLGRPLFWILVLILGLTAFGLSSGQMRIASGDSMVGGTKAWLTSEFAVAQAMTFIVALFYTFFVSVAAGMAVIHDDDLGVGPLLHATPLRAREYLAGKFLAIAGTFVAVLALQVLFTILFNHVVPSPAADEIRGPFAAVNYLRPAVAIALPNILLFAAVAFAVGVWTRTPILVFVFPIALVVASTAFLWEWSPSWLDPGVNRLLMAIDLSGFRWLNETWLKVDRGVDFYNTAPLGFDGVFLANRLVLAGGVLAALVLADRRFARQLRGERAPRRKARGAERPGAAAVGAAASAAGAIPLEATGRRGRAPGLVRGAWIVGRAELRELRTQPGLYLFVPLILLQTVGSMAFDVGAFGTPLLATPGTLAARMMNTLTLLVVLLLLFYVVESLERERRTGLAAIQLATPVRMASLLLGKNLANALVAAAVLLGAFVGCVLVLLFQGKIAPDPRPFVLVWGLLLLPTYLLWTAFVTAIHALTGNRYTTYAVAFGALIFTGYRQMTGRMNWVGNWDLWGVVRWSDMGAFELDRTALVLNRIMALGLAAFFIALTLRVHARAERDASRTGGRLRPGSLLRGALRLSPYALVPLAAGVALWLQVNRGHEGNVAEKKEKDYWRRNLATWRDARPPALVDVDLDLELDPARGWLRSDGTYTLVNQRDTAVRQVPLTRGIHWKRTEWTLNGAPHQPDDRVGLVVFTPERPLAPGDTLRIGFRFEGRYPDGITRNGGGAREFVLPSGVVLTSFSPAFAPVVGYLEQVGVDEENRYEPREYPDDFHEGVVEPLFGTGDLTTTRIRIAGPADYTYNSVGARIADEVTGGKRTTLWVSDRPVRFFNVVAGRWKVREGDGTAIYYHPTHAHNLDEMAEALDAARRHYSEWFTPYPWRELKLSEFPALASYAQGFPTNITFSEGIGFLTKSDPRANAPFMVTAHEAAHQWWGNLLVPGKGPGGNILSEGMSHFSTILLFDRVKGPMQRIEFCKRIEERYGDERRADSERPLVKTDGSKKGDQTVLYDKGGWVFWMLSNHMGRERALAGLRDFIRAFARGPDHAVLQDLVATMRPHAPDAAGYDAFTRQWFHEVVVPEYRLSGARRAKRPGPGSESDDWEVTVEVRNAGTGTMPVEVAAVRGERFPKPGAGVRVVARRRGSGAPEPARGPAERYQEARTTVVLGAGESRVVTLRCPFEPKRVLVDPDALVLQLNREAAVAEL